MKKVLIAPSILSADFADMGREIEKIEAAGADIVHCDVMDGVFVPNITFGLKMIADIKKRTDLPLDVHLMIVEPEKYVERFIQEGADFVTVHYEACKPLAKTLELIRKCGARSGVVINPDTNVSVLNDYIGLCDMVLLMSVFPGFGGQKFIENSIERLKELSGLVKEKNPECLIEIDGGINFDNAKTVIAAGANVLVAGNSVFSANDKKAAIDKLRG